MAIKRPVLRDIVARREIAISEKAILKAGRPRVRAYARKVGDTFTVSFTVTQELDQMIDRHALERNVSRSAVVRQALLLADRHWARR
jgi:hypothetical protein